MKRALALALAAFLLATVGAAQDYRIAYASQKGIFSVNSKGGDARHLADDIGAVISDSAWSPDGKRIMFFIFHKSDASLEYKYNLPFHFPLYLMDADGKNQKRLLDVPVLPDAKWSPDGKSILFTSSFEGDSRRRAVYIVDVASGNRKRLTEFGFNGSASWSPDSKRVVFSSGSRPREIYVVNADGTSLRQLTTLGLVATAPEWSPDGRKIAFVAEGWFLMNADGSDTKRVSSLAASSLAWSPDSRHVLVTGQGSGYVWNADGSKSVMLPTQSGRILDASFSPDGKRVLYRAHEGPRDKIYAVNIDGSNWHTVIEAMGEHALFAVSPLLR